MAHTHDVIDYDKHFVIDPVTRQIDNKSGKIVLMQNDHNSERFTFEIPRYVSFRSTITTYLRTGDIRTAIFTL